VLFHTEVTALSWDEAGTRWIIETSRGDRLTARFVVLGTGPLSVPKLPGIPGIGTRAGFEVTGRDGRTLSEHWADGMRTLHGIHVRGFPNLLFVQPTQGANLISNVPHNIVDSARTITAVVRHAADGAPPAPSTASSSDR
jgi:cyclohexanone monooxygenase